MLTLDGDSDDVQTAATVVDELVELIEQGHEVAPGTIEAVTGAIDAHESPAEILDDVVWRHRNTKVAPKTLNQKRYVDSIRDHTITFGVGPAGTGKTFLAVAMAAAALAERKVQRVILTRPAVEAGERLGFLPGDIQAKVDPYLRPLFDALFDMLDPDRVNGYFERGVIEVAPLAFMRGRAQPLSSAVLTPSGFRPIGTLRVGDLVVGSDGLPTPVLGVYPQGRKKVYRRERAGRRLDPLLRGALVACVHRHPIGVVGGPGGCVETREMSGILRAAHRRRYELPVLGGACRVPASRGATRSLCGRPPARRRLPDGEPPRRASRRRIRELAVALEERLDGIELRPRGGVDYDLHHVAGHRGGVIVSNPVTVALRELGLIGTRSGTRSSCPMPTCTMSQRVRLAVLQGLLDSDGGPVVQEGRTCRVQYTTCSERLRDDVSFFVRSLGGVAYSRRRRQRGRRPGGRMVVQSTIDRTPSSSTSGCPTGSSRSGWRESASATRRTAAVARCAS